MGFGHKIKRRSRKSVFKKGRAGPTFFPPIQVEISMLGIDPNIPVEKSFGLETYPKLRYHKKKSRGKSRKGKRLR